MTRQQRPPRLVAFDVDGTLVRGDDDKVVWQLLNDRFGGSSKESRRRYHAYMSGEISYRRWVDLDVGEWVARGATRDDLAGVILAGIHPVDGAMAMVAALKARGYAVAVISGTLDLVLELVFPGQPFKPVFTNRIWFDARGAIAGWEATPYDMEGKATALRRTRRELGVAPEDTVFVGDNINDLMAMREAGLAVAFEPKHLSVAEAAHHVISDDMRGLLEVLP